ncbi:dirigent protein 23-like [Rhododendron vialii]|uniref:dirigent protein 23-like n=1 Tax=Rhododendron vialii TaxID=182163 RepID=UPI00265F80E9|nr:dirigent protein 23-like [Rhododendron vialii]
MEKVFAILLLCSMVMAIPVVHSIDESPEAVAEWFEYLPKMEEKLTKLQFYFHEQVSGKNPTAVKVAYANMTFQSPTLFGLVVVIDDALTVGPDPNSAIVGRAQGIYESADLVDGVAVMSLSFVFTTGEYNGSTLSLLGRNAVLHPYREMPIVGGSGVFRLARGIATAKTYFFNATSGDAINEYNVAVLHY